MATYGEHHPGLAVILDLEVPLSEFKEASDRILGQKIAESVLSRYNDRKCDWDDPEDVAKYRSDKRSEARRDLLDRLVPSRRCPDCNHISLESRSWVISTNEEVAVCRSCFFRHFGRRGVVTTLPVVLFPTYEKRYTLDRLLFKAARGRTGMSAREFARRAGWSQSYQRKIESGQMTHLSEDHVVTILTVLDEAGVKTRDTTE